MKITSNDVTYHVEVIGQGEPLLLLHGFTGNHETWKDVLKNLGKDYMCIIPDIIGHGKTDSPPNPERYSVEEVSSDLLYILRELHISKAHIIGYSMGGRLALSLALLNPEIAATLVLESSSPGLKYLDERNSRIEQDSKLANMILKEGIPHFVDYWQKIPLFESQKHLSSEKKNKVYLQRLSNNKVGLSNSLLGMGTGAQPSWWSQLDKLEIPVLLLTGGLDTKFCAIAELMKKRIKKCEWNIIFDVGHAIHVENPEMFGRIVSEFVEKWRD